MMKDLWRAVGGRQWFLSASYQPNQNPSEILQPVCTALTRLCVPPVPPFPDQCSQEDHSPSLLTPPFPLFLHFFVQTALFLYPHPSSSRPPLPLFSLSSSISRLLWFKSSGHSLSASGSSKTNGSSLHLLLITPHPPPPLPCLTSPLPRPLLLLRPPFSSSPPPFFPSERIEKKKKKRDNWG